MASCGLLLNSASVFSSDLNSADTQIESITVLGTKTSEEATLGGAILTELPLNAFVLGQAEIERIRFVDPDELLDRIPGETQVRNLRVPDGGKSYTLAFVDGVPIESPYNGATQRFDRVNTFDIKRVEIIKGPTSALYPNNVFGGSVNVVTRDAPLSTQTKISAEAGNFGRERLGFSLGSKVADLGYFIDINTRRLDGLREGAQSDRDVGSVKFVYDLGENTKITSRIETLEEFVEERGDLTAEQISEDPTQAGSLSSSTDFDQDTASVAINHRLASGELNAVVLQRTKSEVGISRFGGPEDSIDDAINIKASYQHDFDKGVFTVGFDRYQSDVDTKSFARGDNDLVGPFDESTSELDINAYFAQYQVGLTEALKLTAGLRYEDIELSSTVYPDQQANFGDLAPKLGLTYQLADTHQIWFSASEGFYAPEIDDLFNAENGNPNLNPEEAQNFEIGLRGEFGDIAYNTSFYDLTIDNYLVTQEFVNARGEEFELTTNASQVSIKGIESVIEYAPSDANWRIGLTHTYADNRYDSFVQSTPGADDDLTGKELRRTPRHHLNARIAWEPVANLVAELEEDFYSSYFSDDANSEAGKFTRDERLNARLTYQMENWRFWLNVINITDTLEDRATFSLGTLTFRTVDGRSYNAGLSYQF